VAAEAVLKNCIKLRERSNKYIKKGREWISEVVNQTGLMALSLSAGREVENRHTISSLFLGEVCGLLHLVACKVAAVTTATLVIYRGTCSTFAQPEHESKREQTEELQCL
jgi:hypothetical protein